MQNHEAEFGAVTMANYSAGPSGIISEPGLSRSIRRSAPVGSIGPGDVVGGTFAKEIVGLARVPNVVTVVYTDAQGDEWVDQPYSTPLPGGGVPVREQRISMPRIQSRAQAGRYATERLNKYTLARLSGSFSMRDDGIRYLRGEIVSLTDVEGASAKPVRIVDVRAREKGFWDFDYIEHDPLLTSDTIVAEANIPDTSLPNPNAVPAVTIVTLAVNLPQFKSGRVCYAQMS